MRQRENDFQRLATDNFRRRSDPLPILLTQFSIVRFTNSQPPTERCISRQYTRLVRAVAKPRPVRLPDGSRLVQIRPPDYRDPRSATALFVVCEARFPRPK